MVKNLPAKAGETKKHTFDPWVGKIPLEEGMATHSSILAWRIPWTEEPGGLQSIEPHRVRHDWSDLACTHANVLGVSLVDQKAKNLPLRQETWVQFPGWEDPLKKEVASPLQYSCLRNPTDRRAWQATVHGVTKSQTWLNDFHFTYRVQIPNW